MMTEVIAALGMPLTVKESIPDAPSTIWLLIQLAHVLTTLKAVLLIRNVKDLM